MIDFKPVHWVATKKPFYYTVVWQEAMPKPENRSAGFVFTVRLIGTHFTSAYRSTKPRQTAEEAMLDAERYTSGESDEAMFSEAQSSVDGGPK